MDAFKIKKGLGRGLSSLIGEAKVKDRVNKVLIGDLIRNKYQPRKVFNKEKLQELASSIKERGIIQPIIVRPSEGQIGKFEIIAVLYLIKRFIYSICQNILKNRFIDCKLK